MLAFLTVSRTALAEDERSACATTAEQAQELRVAHKLKDAREKLVECSRPSCPEIVSHDCNQWLSEVNAVMPSLVIRAIDSNGVAVTAVRLWIDGVSTVNPQGDAIAVDPGTHQLHVEADAMLPVDQQITFAEGETNRTITIRLVPLHPPASVITPHSPAPRTSRLVTALPYALASVGVVALGSFTYFGLKGTSEASDLAGGCGATKSCSESQVDPVRRHLLIADVSLGISLVSLGAATWIFVTRNSARPKHATGLQVGLTPGTGMVKMNVDF